MKLNRKDLLTIEELTPEEIILILETAKSIKEGSFFMEEREACPLKGKIIINLFYEPSTR
ncbi:MAG: aspartate carbamoyltransferase, partial [Desulfobacterota bacterium]|nr:aspartate carbamoyltransferase [Thermodesulfobacteriota bacterium]